MDEGATRHMSKSHAMVGAQDAGTHAVLFAVQISDMTTIALENMRDIRPELKASPSMTYSLQTENDAQLCAFALRCIQVMHHPPQERQSFARTKSGTTIDLVGCGSIRGRAGVD